MGSITQLLAISVNAALRVIKRLVLRYKLRTMHRAAAYFQWQQDNGNEGLRHAHTRIMRIETELRDLG